MMQRISRPILALLVLSCGDDEGDDGATSGVSVSVGSVSISGSPSPASGMDTTADAGTGTGTDTGEVVTSGGPSPMTGETTDGLKFDLAGEETGAPETTMGPDDACPCAPKLDLIYVLSDNRQLWTYDPPNNSFAMVGALGCPTTDGTFSMGVGRDGKAWVQTTYPQGLNNYIGDLFVLDVNNPADCVDPGYTPGANGWQHFGMGFVSNNALDPCDKLYAQHWDGIAGGFSEGPNVGKLGVFDQAGLQVNTIGTNNYNGGELTGTGDGRLYEFAGSPSSKLIQFDKANAQVLETIPFNNFPLTNAFAFAFWGGDFYFFTEANLSVSKVTKLDYDDSDNSGKALTVVNPQAPIRIVGAGVSTCAPVVPPN
jgi:hypothetical protein